MLHATNLNNSGPGNAILIAGATIDLNDAVSDVIVRFLRIRRSYDKAMWRHGRRTVPTPTRAGSAWPRFHDIYAQAGGQASYDSLADNGGDTFRLSLRRALTNSATFAQLVTLNDFGEGTIIEPTKEFHFHDLAIALRIYNLRRQYTNNPAIAAELDQIFTNDTAGNLEAAQLRLAGIKTPGSGRSSIRVTSIKTSGADVESTIPSLAGLQYQLQSRNDLMSGGWKNVGSPTAGNNAPTTLIHRDGGSDRQRYYRVTAD